MKLLSKIFQSLCASSFDSASQVLVDDRNIQEKNMKHALFSLLLPLLTIPSLTLANDIVSSPVGHSIDSLCRIANDLRLAPEPGANPLLANAIAEGIKWTAQIGGDTATMVVTNVTTTEVHYVTDFKGKTHTGTKIIMAEGAPYGIRGWKEGGRWVGALYWISNGQLHSIKPEGGSRCSQTVMTPERNPSSGG